jgi:hypothetical protein
MGNDRRTIAHAGSNLAAYCLALGDLAEARSAARDSLREARSLGLPLYLVNAVEHLAVVGVQAGQVEQAARLLGYCYAWYRAEGITRQGTEKTGNDRLNALLAQVLPELMRNNCWPKGPAGVKPKLLRKRSRPKYRTQSAWPCGQLNVG